MNRFIFLFLITFGCFSLLSCRRKAIHKEYTDFMGYWYHKETNGESWHLDMGEKSWGTITVYDADGSISSKHLYGENPRRWRYNPKRKELTNGMISERFKVDQLPTIAETTIINGYDTIPAGRTYCIIEHDYYIKSK